MSRCYEDFVQHVSELFHNHFPCPEEDFNSLMQQAEDNSEQKFRGQVLGEKSEFYLRELQGRLRKYIQERREENEQRAMEPIKEYITRGFKPLVKKLNSHEYK